MPLLSRIKVLFRSFLLFKRTVFSTILVELDWFTGRPSQRLLHLLSKSGDENQRLASERLTDSKTIGAISLISYQFFQHYELATIIPDFTIVIGKLTKTKNFRAMESR